MKPEKLILSCLCFSVCLCTIDVWSRSSFQVILCRLPQCWCWQNNWSVLTTHLLWTHFCCKFWLIIVIQLKWHLKCPRNFQPTTSLDITKDFHILHSAYIYICYSILKAKTYNWLPNTHTHAHTRMTSNNYKQKATGHVTSLANGHFTDADAPFVCEIPTVLSN